MMQATRLRVCFNDEAPRIGSGWRIVLASIGRKIVHVADQHGHRARFSKEAWAVKMKTAIELPEKKRRRKKKAVQ